MSIQPEGENLRKAVKWISDERTYGPAKKLSQLIEAACLQFDLTPKEAEYLYKMVRQDE